MNRRLRTKPSSRPVVQLTPRCADVLTIVAQCGYMSASQIARDAFPSEDRCRRRLRQLLDARLIAATLVSSREANLISITRDGLSALHDVGVDVTGLRPPTPLRLSAIPHFLLAVDVRMYAANLAPDGLGRLLAWHPGKGEEAHRIGLSAARLAPDAIACIQLGDQQGVAMVEVDRGHESVSGALAEKLTKYATWLPCQTNTQVWLVADGDAARVKEVCRACERSGAQRWMRVLLPDDLRRRPIAGTPRQLNRLTQSIPV